MAESQAYSAENPIIDCKDEEEIEVGNEPEKLKNRAMIEASNDFATRLVREFLGSESVCISPISISFVLAMSLVGAKGETEAEILKLLGKDRNLDEIEAFFVEIKSVFQQLSERNILHDANRIYYDLSLELLETYKEKVTQLYGKEAFDLLNFKDADGTSKKINSFVEENTKANLKNVISGDQVTGNCMILLNALDFRGKWEKQFYAESNVIKEFHLLNGTTKKTVMMTRSSSYYSSGRMTYSDTTASRYFYYENDEMQRICLSYRNGYLKEDGESDFEKNSSHKTDVGEISMYIFLPRERKGLPKLVEDLDGEKLLKWLRLKPLQDYRQEEPTLMFPKFTINCDVKLKDTLEKIGLEHYFNVNADFSATSNEPLYATNFIHKTFIQTDELGTKASAATYMCMRYRSRDRTPEIPVKVIKKEFHADRPFLYAIVSRKQHVLFIGTVMDVDEKSESELRKRRHS
ncbi:serpin (serine protease inhibitor) domain-containing protein [Ditylenchus destructor]|nr:serpin (serine protease inhibitor) domain-containing protein [Ditylenchus destructor]